MSDRRQCLYDILAVSQDATDTDLKKAYRLAAVKHHPDKNPGCEAEAVERFKRVQHAYEVLSDRHERAWYDAHREQILRGDSSDDEPTAADATNVDIFAYFSSSAYDSFANSSGDNANKNSFYSVYESVFRELWAEEIHAAGRAGERIGTSPEFGHRNSDWNTVREFYDHWESFTSVKAFSYADKWNLAKAENRDYRRAMEKENKRERAKAKKEYIGVIRELAAFVKKRDPRVKEKRAKEELERVEREKLRKEREEQDALNRKKRAAEVRAAREVAIDEDANALDEILASIALDEKIDRRRQRRKNRRAQDTRSSESEQELPSDANDEVANADSAVLSGDAGRDDGGGEVNEEDSESEEEYTDEDEDDLYCAACRKKFKTSAQGKNHRNSKKHLAAIAKLRAELEQEDLAFASSAADVDEPGSESVSAMDDAHPLLNQSERFPLDDQALAFSKKDKKKRKAKRKLQGTLASSVSESGENQSNLGDAPGESAETSIVNGIDAQTNPPADTPSTAETQGNIEPKMSKKEKRRAREKRKATDGNQSQANQSLRCNVCNSNFPSRNKLMRHVEERGHALHVDQFEASRRRR